MSRPIERSRRRHARRRAARGRHERSRRALRPARSRRRERPSARAARPANRPAAAPPRTNATRSHSRSASSRLWVASTIVRPGAAQRLDGLAHDVRRLGIERRGRLVEEDDGRLVEQGTGDRQLLLHALAEVAGHVVAPVPQREEAQVVLDPLGARRRVERRRAARRSRGWPSPTASRRAPASRSGSRPARGPPPAAR